MGKNLEVKAQEFLDSAAHQYIDEKITFILEHIEVSEENLVNFKDFKAFVKEQVKTFALQNLDISTLDPSKRNVRETYMYRAFLDDIYASYIQLPKVDAFQDLIMNSLNELRGGCTNSLKGETEETIDSIKECMKKIDEFNHRIASTSNAAEQENLKAQKAKFISAFDDSIKNRSKQDKDIERPSEKNRPMNPEGKDRAFSSETTIINSILAYMRQKIVQAKNTIRFKEVERVITKTETKTVSIPQFITVEKEKIVEKEPPKKPQITFDGSDGFYKLNIHNETKTFRPTLSGKDIKQFRRVLLFQYASDFPLKSELAYDPQKVIDVNIYGMLRMYDKSHGTHMSKEYVHEVIRLCRKDADIDKDRLFDIHYDLSQMEKSSALGKGLTGLVRKHRIKNFAEANGQDGIDIAKYTRSKKARHGLLSISGKRGSIKPVDLSKVTDIEVPENDGFEIE